MHSQIYIIWGWGWGWAQPQPQPQPQKSNNELKDNDILYII